MATEVGVGYVRLIPSMQGFSAAASAGMSGALVRPANKAGATAGTGFATGMAASLTRNGPMIAGVGDKMTKGLTLPLVGLGAIAWKASKDFNAGMANVATLIPGNTARVNELKVGVQDMAMEVGKSTSDLSDGLYQVVSAFGDSSESLGILDVNARAATGGLATTTDAINLTSAVTKGYGDTSEAAIQKAADLGLMTVRLGQTDFPALSASIGKVIPLASQLGVTQEEVFATMATFTGVTGEASEVSTQLRSALQALMAPTSDAEQAISAAGFANGQAAIEALGLEGAIGLLTDAADQSGKPLQSFIGQVEGQTLALGLAGAQSDDYQSKLAEMGNAAGTTDEAFAEATEGINAQGFEWEQAKARAEVFAQRLGDGLAPALVAAFDAAEPVIDAAVGLATAFANAGPGTQKLIVGVVGIVAALGPVLSITGRVMKATSGLIKGFATVGKGALKTGNGIGKASMWFGRLAASAARAGARVGASMARIAAQAVTATARVAAQIAIQVARWALLGAKALLHAAKVAAAWLISLGPIAIVGAAVIALVALVVKNWDKITAAISAGWNWVKRVTASVWNWVVGKVRGAAEWIVSMFKNWSLPGLIAKHWNTIKLATAAVWNWVTSKVSGVIEFFKGVPEKLKNAASGMWNFVKDGFKSAINTVIGWWNAIRFPTFSIPSVSIPGLGSVGGGSIGGWSMPQITPFARGGIVTGPTLGLLGEAGEDEAVAPLSKLEDMLGIDTTTTPRQGAAAPVVVIDGNGLDRELLTWLRKAVRVKGGGNVQVALGQGAGR